MILIIMKDESIPELLVLMNGFLSSLISKTENSGTAIKEIASVTMIKNVITTDKLEHPNLSYGIHNLLLSPSFLNKAKSTVTEIDMIHEAADNSKMNFKTKEGTLNLVFKGYLTTRYFEILKRDDENISSRKAKNVLK